MKPISLAIADDQILFRKGLKLLIHSFDGIELVIEVSNGVELLSAVQQNQPDVILMDLRMPEMDGLEATGKIKKLFPSIKVILLTMYDEEHLINHMMKLGANGYLLKNEEPEEVEFAIRSVMKKDFYFNDYVSKALLSGLRHPKHEMKNLGSGAETSISKREREVLELICREFTSSEIAKELYISIRTVENHRKNLLAKTNARNTAGLILFAVRNQLIDVGKGTG